MNTISISCVEDLWVCCEHCGNNFYTSLYKAPTIFDTDLIVKWCSKECMKKEYDERNNKKNEKNIKALCWIKSKDDIDTEYGP